MTADPATGHRRDIDGLRAVAVLAVVVYHLARDRLPGGYLGVDIFFVISGYLITGIIWREASGDGFSIRRFYERRLRRIAPALLAMLLLVSVAASLILLPIDLIGFGRSLLATLVFVSNVYFWRDADYFSRAAAEKPLLHTWSLGIEEQFYILFPLLIMATGHFRRGWTPWVIAAVAIGSLAANVVALRIGAGLPAFYLLPTRAWELGTGSLLVFIPPPERRGVAEVLAAVGAVLVALAIATRQPWLPAAAPAALAAVVGSALLIVSGSRTRTFASRALGLRLAVFVGLISYSLYLWHWPLIVLVQYWLVRSLTPGEALLLLVPMLALATASWRYVEQPFRDRVLPVPRLIAFSAGGTLLAAGVAAGLIVSKGLPARLSPAAARINAAAGTNYRCPIGDYLAFGASRGCRLVLPGGDPESADAVLLGNSHAQMYAPLVADILAAHAATGLLVPANGCLPIAAVNISAECVAVARTNIEAVANLRHARLVILGLTWTAGPGPLVDGDGRRAAVQGPAGIAAGIAATAARLHAAGKQVVVIGPIATPGWDVASTLSRSIAFGRAQPLPLFAPRARFERDYAAAFDRLARTAGIGVARPDCAQCRGDRCDFVAGGDSLFADDNHLAVAALPRFRAAIEPAIVAALQVPRPGPAVIAPDGSPL